jgi:choline dehydrogenase
VRCFVAAFIVTLSYAKPLTTSLRARQLLGYSFGVPGDNVTCDYVIVGGGTAGLTLATRLVEQNAGTVAVVEAGTFYEISNDNLSQVPATGGTFSGKDIHDWLPLIDWGYISTPQVVSFPMSGERQHINGTVGSVQ